MPQDLNSVYAPFATHLLSFWLYVAALCVALPALAFLGHRVGERERRRRKRAEPDQGLPGEMSIGALLALLGLLLGFTFGATLHWREGRAAAVVEESAAIGTAFLRADLLPDGAGRPLQEALLAYGRTRIVPAGFRPARSEVEGFLVESLQTQAALWPSLKMALGPAVPTPMQVHVSTGVTEVLDMHTRRVAAASKTIPLVTMAFLMFVTGAGVFTIGNRSALQGRQLSWRTFLFSLVLAFVLISIEDPTAPRTASPPSARVRCVRSSPRWRLRWRRPSRLSLSRGPDLRPSKNYRSRSSCRRDVRTRLPGSAGAGKPFEGPRFRVSSGCHCIEACFKWGHEDERDRPEASVDCARSERPASDELQ